jgi:hypothetical protein
MIVNSSFIKRYKIISLLYLVFICFSILNIKVSVLDSNIYTINSFRLLSKNEEKKVSISEKVILDNLKKINVNSKAISYTNISNRIKQSEIIIDSTLNFIENSFKNNQTSLLNEFNNEFYFKKIFEKRNYLNLIYNDLNDLSKQIKKSEYSIENILDSNIPIKSNIITISKENQNFIDYLFFHKPTGISYMQLERIKLLLIKTQLLFNEAALAEIGYIPTYFSKSNNITYSIKLNEYNSKDEKITNNSQKSIFINDDQLNNLYKNIASSIQTENIFQGMSYTLFHNFDFSAGKDFNFKIYPKVNITKKNNDFNVIFNKTGEYTLEFTDSRFGDKTIYTKKIFVNSLPDPIIKLKGDNLNSYLLNVKTILNSSRLDVTLKINNSNYFPGRINSFNVIKLHNGKEENSVLNYGELFQSPTIKIISSLEKNDILIFDVINISLIDGSTRITQPLVYKIIE